MKKHKKRLLSWLLVVGLIAGTVGCGTAKEDKTEKVILKFGHFPTTIQPILAEQLGYFDEELEEYGVDIELVSFNTGSAIKEALEANELTFGTIAAQPTILANNNGTPLRIFGTYKTNEECNALVARKDAEIEQLSDLKGKKIGYTAGTILHYLLLKILEEGGLTEKDVELFPMDATEIKAALGTGDIDAGILWEPYITQILKEDNIELIVDGTGLVKEVAGYVASEEYINDNAEVAAAVLKALDRAWLWAEENMDEAVKMIAESSGSAEDEIQAIFDKSDGGSYITQDKIDAIDEAAQYLYEQEMTSTKIDGDTIVDLTVQEKSGISAD